MATLLLEISNASTTHITLAANRVLSDVRYRVCGSDCVVGAELLAVRPGIVSVKYVQRPPNRLM